MLPSEWEQRLVDLNLTGLRPRHLAWTDDAALLKFMTLAGFDAVFVGIETPVALDKK